jgi:hypothetical protein
MNPSLKARKMVLISLKARSGRPRIVKIPCYFPVTREFAVRDGFASDCFHYQPVCAYQLAEAQSGKEPANCGLFRYVARVMTLTSGRLGLELVELYPRARDHA